MRCPLTVTGVPTPHGSREVDGGTGAPSGG
jgi:hypothetical protein